MIAHPATAASDTCAYGSTACCRFSTQLRESLVFALEKIGFLPRQNRWLSGMLAGVLALPLMLASESTLAQTGEGSNRTARRGDASVPRTRAEDRSSRSTAKSKGDLTFDDLKFEMEVGTQFKREMLTKEIEALHKKTIRIRGYILPATLFKQTGIENFVLVRDNMECCFGPGAALYDCIIVEMEKGKTIDFTTRPVAVRGRFEAKVFNYPESEEVYAIYKMTATEVK